MPAPATAHSPDCTRRSHARMQQTALRDALDVTPPDLDVAPPSPVATPAFRASPTFLFALVMVLSAGTLWVMHGNVLRYPFLEDDYIFLTQVPRGLFGSVEHAIRSVDTYFRPVSRELYFWGLHRLFGSEPLGFHLVNAALLLCTIALVSLIG